VIREKGKNVLTLSFSSLCVLCVLCGLLFPMIKLLVKALTVDPPQPPLIRGEKSNLKNGGEESLQKGGE